MTTTQKLQQRLNDSKAMRWTVLIIVSFTTMWGYFLTDAMSPLMTMLEEQMGWTSSDFGTFNWAYCWLNVFLFMLIIGGIILDKMGVRFTALLSGAVMLVGAVIKWYAVTDAFATSSLQVWFTEHLNYIPGFDELGVSPFYEGMPASAKVAAIGFMIFGCGVEMAGITVSRGIVKWFKFNYFFFYIWLILGINSNIDEISKYIPDFKDIHVTEVIDDVILIC